MRGTIESKNYPRNYDNNDEYRQVHEAAVGSTIKILFKDFRLEPKAIASDTCEYDWLKITEGDEELLPKCCGDTIPDVIFSNSRKVNVTFKSDGNNTDKGFKYHWYSVMKDSTVKRKKRNKSRAKIEPSKIRCAGTSGDIECCSKNEKCGYGEGDCDEDADCENGLG